jgi:hypothetical protein
MAFRKRDVDWFFGEQCAVTVEFSKCARGDDNVQQSVAQQGEKFATLGFNEGQFHLRMLGSVIRNYVPQRAIGERSDQANTQLAISADANCISGVDRRVKIIED